MQNIKISIGKMAKMHKISTQTLRYYDEINLFKPLYIDKYTGYRYYKFEQFAHLEAILYLKNMGMSLEKIKMYFQNRDINSMMSLMKMRINYIDNEIKQLKKKKNHVNAVLNLVDEYMNMNKDVFDKCILKKLPRREMLYFNFQKNSETIAEHEFGIKKIEMALNSIDELYMNPFASVIDRKMLDDGHYSTFKGISMIFSNKVPENIKTIPIEAATYATMTFVGTYNERVEKRFNVIADWIHENKYELAGDGFILIITDKAFTDYDYEYISEIQIPIKLKD